MDFEILVQLKGEVLDPEGRAIQETLQAQGISGVSSVQVSKRYVLSFSPDISTAESERLANKVAESYLSNPVAQTYSLRKLPT
jgi:phosphoribosylformylglycinamidine synthase PurS subunit